MGPMIADRWAQSGLGRQAAERRDAGSNPRGLDHLAEGVGETLHGGPLQQAERDRRERVTVLDDPPATGGRIHRQRDPDPTTVGSLEVDRNDGQPRPP